MTAEPEAERTRGLFHEPSPGRSHPRQPPPRLRPAGRADPGTAGVSTAASTAASLAKQCFQRRAKLLANDC